MSDKRSVILSNLLSQIEERVPFKDKKNPSVSKSDVGWQLDHALKVVNAVCGIMIKTNPNKYKKDFNLMRTVLFPLCYIPRGKGKAPKIVTPPNSMTTADLENQLIAAKVNLEHVKPLPKKSHFKHPIFGMLTKEQTLRFLEMHTKHHLKIVNDILKK